MRRLVKSFVVLAGACAITGLTACEPASLQPPVTIQSPSQEPTQPLGTSSHTAGKPTLVPYTSPADGSALVLMNDDGSGLVVFGMSASAFYKRAAEIGWDCQPPNKPGVDGFVNVGATTFIFGSDGLHRIDVADSSFQTQGGFAVGDSIAKMEQLYGTNYERSNASDVLTYTYVLPSGLQFYVVTTPNSLLATGWGFAYLQDFA